jgi:hypothetical protein
MHADVNQLGHVIVVVVHDASQHVHPGFFR